MPIEDVGEGAREAAGVDADVDGALDPDPEFMPPASSIDSTSLGAAASASAAQTERSMNR